jgi:hypothetical protein
VQRVIHNLCRAAACKHLAPFASITCLALSQVELELVVYDQLFHSLGIENHASYHYSSILQSTYIDHMTPVFHRAAAEGKVVIDAQNSYPMGKGAGPLAHPDLLKLAALDGVLYDLRVIIIYRDPVDAVLSAVRRFQNKEVCSFYFVVPCCCPRVASHLRFRISQFT